MDAEKNTPPSLAKLKKARKKGHVAKSTELATSCFLATAFVWIWAIHLLYKGRIKEIFYSVYETLNQPTWESSFQIAIMPILLPMCLILIGFFILAIGVSLLQTGWIWAPFKLSWKKKKSEKRILLPLSKAAVLAGIGYLVMKKVDFDFMMIFSSSVVKQEILFDTLFSLSVEIAAVFILLGIIDFFYQRWKFFKKMHSTHQEQKEEKRESEGDPKIKAQLKKRK